MKHLNQFLNSNFIYKLQFTFIIFISILILLFGRAGQGVFLYYFRIGELFFGILILLSLFQINLKSKESKLQKTYSYFVIFFLVVLGYGGFEFPESLRASSFVFSFSMYLILENSFNNKKYLSRFSYFIFYLSNIGIVIFLLNNYFNEQLFYKLFANISDKPYSFVKVSEIAVVVIFIFYFTVFHLNNSRLKYMSLTIIGLVTPVIIYFSRGATLGLLFGLAIIYYFSKNKNIVNKYLLYALMFSLISFLNLNNLIIEEGGQNFSSFFDDYIVGLETIEGYDKPPKGGDLNCGNSTFKIPIITNDGNINWRLWVLEDIVNCNTASVEKFLIGYGFNEPIISMQTPLRSGYDGLNTYPHNFFLTVLYRLGFIGIFFITTMLLSIVKDKKYIIYSPSLITFMIVSSFGVVFEGFTQLIFWIYIFIENNLNSTSG